MKSLNHQKHNIHVAAIAMTTLATALTGCRKDLCFNHFRSVTVETSYDTLWERDNGVDVRSRWNDSILGHSYDEYTPAPGELVECLVYNKDEGTTDKIYINSTCQSISLPSGTNSLMFFNNETDVMEFYNLDDRKNAMCITVPRSRSTYTKASADEVTVAEPEMMYGCYLSDIDDIQIHEERNLQAYMTPLVFSYVINIRFEHGIEYVALARGVVAGMARGVYLRDGGTTAETATIFFDDCEMNEYGLVTKLNAFGPPNYTDADFNGPAPSRSVAKSASTGTQTLSLEVRLTNGTIKQYTIDITKQIALQPTGGLITVTGLRVEDDEAVGGNSAWDVSVDNWNEENVTLSYD